MPAGLEVTNEAGSVQIDQDHFSLSLKEKGTLTFSAHTDQATTTTLAVSSLTTPLVAISVPANIVSVKKMTISGGTYTWTFYSNLAVSGTCEYFLFDQQPAAPSTFGLEVFNASGLRTFHSGKNIMRVKSVYTDLFNVNYADGRKYAVIQSARKEKVDYLYSPDEDPNFMIEDVVRSEMGCSTPLGTAQAAYFEESNQISGNLFPDGTPDYTEYNGTARFIVVDVTNF